MILKIVQDVFQKQGNKKPKIHMNECKEEEALQSNFLSWTISLQVHVYSMPHRPLDVILMWLKKFLQ